MSWGDKKSMTPTMHMQQASSGTSGVTRQRPSDARVPPARDTKAEIYPNAESGTANVHVLPGYISQEAYVYSRPGTRVRHLAEHSDLSF